MTICPNLMEVIVTDPWLQAAERIRDEREAAERARAEEAERLRLEQERKRAEAKRKYAEMQVAIAEGTRALEQFLRERGAAAQAVMAARGDQRFISFGGHSSGGGYTNAFFYAHGLARESGRGGGYGPFETAGPRPISAEEAVTAYATEGEGRDRPDRVRDIVSWFKRRIDSEAGLNRD